MKYVAWLVVMVLLPVVVHAQATAPVTRPQLIVSKETTFFTGPLREDGSVDYIAALNEHYSQGVTPENNAAAALWPYLADRDGYRRQATERQAELLGVVTRRGAATLEWPDGTVYQALTTTLSQPWKDNELPEVRQWLNGNGEVLSEVKQALRRRRYYMPLVAYGDQAILNGMSFSEGNSHRTILRTLMVSGNNHFAEGRLGQAIDDWLSMRQLTNHIQHGPSLMNALSAITTDSLSNVQLDRLLQDHRLTLPQARTILQSLQDFPPPSPLETAIDYGYRSTMLQMFQAVYTGELKPKDFEAHGLSPDFERLSLQNNEVALPAFFDTYTAMGLMNQYCDQFSGLSNVKYFKKLDLSYQAIEESLRASSDHNMCRKAHDPQAFDGRFSVVAAKSIVSFSAPSHYAAIKLQLLSHAAYEIRMVAAGLEVYRLEHGRYPETLAALVPEELDALPVDRYDGRALTYKLNPRGGDDAQTYLLYGIGPNGKDDGGLDDPRDADIAVGNPRPLKLQDEQE